ncbi:MAG: hypothetical protein H6738_25875, partial [Alphaproteobacteria bacterium]|nr:hypothetical protein [Alphaproteobacteria bacterium]
DTFLAATCIALDGAVQDVGRTRLVLLREEGAGYGYVGTLLEGADARALGADTLEQADVSLASDGSWLLVVTPILKASDPMHQGCLGLTIADLGAARVARDDDGVPVVRARITGEGNLLGPGLCTYDRDLPGGITMVLSSYDLDGAVPDIAFGLYATHVAP